MNGRHESAAADVQERGNFVTVPRQNSPDTRNALPAIGTGAVGRNAVAQYTKTPAFDHRGLAVRAARVFELAELARQVARVDVTQSRGASDFGRPLQSFRRSVLRPQHLVIFVEGGDVPGNVGGDACDELGGG